MPSLYARVLASRRSAFAVAAALFVVATIARFALPDPANGVGFLFLVPICLIATDFGWRGGLASGGIAFGLIVTWTQLEGVTLSGIGYSSRAITYLSVGWLVGVLGEQRRRHAAESERWFELSNGLLCVADREGRFTRVNGAWTEALGYAAPELVERPFLDFVHPDDRDATVAATEALSTDGSAVVDFENRYRAKDGTWRWLLWTARSDGEQIYAVAKDITDRKHAEHARLRNAAVLALTDELTGLPNRRVWDEHLPRELARAGRSGEPLCVAMLDLDGLKALNDTRGHQAGSDAIRQAAAAWDDVLRGTDLLVRFGGDEFAALLPGTGISDAEVIGERLRAAITGLEVTVSIGIAQWAPGDSIDAIVERADEALYAAKRAGRDRLSVVPVGA